MAFKLSECIGLTLPSPDEAMKFYAELLGMTRSATPDGLKLTAGPLAFYIDPGSRQPPILELLTEDLEVARPLLRALGFHEQTWNGPGKLNMATDPFGVAWNVFQSIPESEWPSLETKDPTVPPKIALHLHEVERAAQFYSDVFDEPATKTPSGWTIDSNQVRIIIEPGLPPGPAFYVDPNAATEPDRIKAFFQDRRSKVDPFGVTWKLTALATNERAVINPKH